MPMTRRRFLGAAAATAVALPHVRHATATTTEAVKGDALFAAGVASGDPDARSVVLWTRLFDAPDAPLPDEVAVTWEVSATPEFSALAASGSAMATRTHAHSVHVVADVGAGVWYYRFTATGATSATGRTVVAAADASSLLVASASCQHYETGFYAAHRDLAEQLPDLVVWLGDYIYEDGRSSLGGVVVRQHDGPEPTTLDGYRARYALYKSDPDLRAAHAAAPWLVMWDDHEVENNYASLIPQDPADTAGFAARRDAAYQAWWEHTPTRLAPPVAAQEYHVYRSVTWGSLATIILLDGRQYRSDQACGDVAMRLDPPCPELTAAGRTMLGEVQERFVADALTTSASTWNVLGNQTVMADARINDAVLNYDQWDGYPEARARLFDLLQERAVPNVVVLTGDIHLAAVAQLRHGDAASGPVLGAEFITTSVSSVGLVDPSFTEVLKNFPSLVDAELVHRGYVLHTVTPHTWTAEYRIVDDVSTPHSAVRTHATFTVAAGTNAVVGGQ